ncbi:MAG: dipeptide epimerase [Alphaproteobacteria bacterium]|nr:dipeptide epimerase [Alphaproteobacteria bacterium]
MQVEVTAESWPIAGSFTIARGSKTKAETVLVRLTKSGATGHGESVPYARYQETVPQCVEALKAIRPQIEAGLTRIGAAKLGLPKAAQNALDCALWDLEAKSSGTPAWGLANLHPPKPAITAYTLSLDTPEAMAAAAAKSAHYPLLKLKLGHEGDVERLAAIRAAVPRARLIVDANEGWSPAILPEMLKACETYGVELVEQPLPAGDDEALRGLKRNTIICADESAHDIAGLAHLRGKYDAINIKLDKTGGLTQALALAKAAKAMDFKIMVGCMLATSLAMAPAFLLAQMADYVDLDGPLLLVKDRPHGIAYHNGIMQPPPADLWG